MVSNRSCRYPTLKIGVILPLSGEAAPFGAVVRAGIEQATRHGVQFHFEDSACRTAQALRAYHKLKSHDNVQYFLGPCCGASLTGIAPLLAKSPQLAMSICGTSQSHHHMAGGNILIPQYSIEQEDAFIAKQMIKRGVTSVAIVMIETDFSVTHERGFRRHFFRAG